MTFRAFISFPITKLLAISPFLSASSSVYSAQYLTFLAPSSGTLYRNYAYGRGTVSAVREYYTISGNSGGVSAGTIGSLTYVPALGYKGIVTIPFYAIIPSSGAISGVLRINVTTSSFSDVVATNPDHWFAPYVSKLQATGIIQGKTATTFVPHDQVTYGEALKMILLAAGHPEQALSTTAHWATNYLTFAKSLGIVAANETVDLGAPISRETMAVYVAKALKLSSAASVKSGITAPSDTTNGYVYAIYNAGIMEGDTHANGVNYYYPNRTISRAEIAKIACNVFDYVK